MLMTQYAAFCCYFGKWPLHFQFWLESCRYNKNITFFLVTDISVANYAVPANVRFVEMSFPEVRDLICVKFPDINVCLDRPYKLCDFKTAYGYIFADFCKGYDYWGYYDIDTIWGNIEKFIPENQDNRYVKIFPCGHLCFIRNDAPWNEVFRLVDKVEGTPCRNNMFGKKVSNWEKCFSSKESFYYDEEGGLEPLFASLQEEVYHGVDFDNILPPWRFDHFYSINFPEKSHFLVYSFCDGTLKRLYLKQWKICAEEISYVHLSKRTLKIRTGNSEQFSIVPNTIQSTKRWNVLTLLWYGRPRYLQNFFKRVLAKI